MTALLTPILEFLHCPTPEAWLDAAEQHPDLLLVDHCNCELKAAVTAVRLMGRYQDVPLDKLHAWLQPYQAVAYGRAPVDSVLGALRPRVPVIRSKTPMVEKLMLLVREELHHFEQVLAIMLARGVAYQAVSASRYASGLRLQVRHYEPEALVDQLIIGAYIEARSCERFAALALRVDEELASFYRALLRSEARHFQDYLALAQSHSPVDIASRVKLIGETEAALILKPDNQLRFHSGVPAQSG